MAAIAWRGMWTRESMGVCQSMCCVPTVTENRSLYASLLCSTLSRVILNQN